VHTPLQAKEEKIKKYQRKKSTDAQHNATYAAMIESMDENIGRLLKCLGRLGLSDNTFVVFTSDNGGVWKISKQWPLRAGKGSYYEGGIREPMIVRWPGRTKTGTKCDVPVSGIDLYPTFLEVAGVRKHKGKILDGASLVPVLTQTGNFADRALFWHFPVYIQNGNEQTRDMKFRTRPGSVVRYGRWKLHEYFEDGEFELYDLQNDVGERNNLAEAMPEKTMDLRKILYQWRKETAAPVPSRLNPEYKDK